MPLTRLTRRVFLAALGLGGLAALPLVRWLEKADPTQTLHDRLRPHLRACLDTLLPADALTPAATELDLDIRLLERLAGLPSETARLYANGLDWCERQARSRHGRSFIELDETARDAILQAAAEQSTGTMPARFIHQLRDQAFELYYSRPEVVAHIPGAGPPQPLGYPGYNEPPA